MQRASVLLNIMFCPLSNSTVKQCNRSIAMLFTISEGVVGAIRRNLDRICEDQSLEDYQLREGWDKLGYTYRNHPILRYDAEIRANIELHLNMVLRADPAGGVGVNVCRVYSPEVNTHEKLRKLLSSLMNAEKEDQSQTGSERPVEGESQTNNGNRTGCECRMSSSTMQRIIDNYLETRNLRIVFQQTDHNACPNCKAMEYALTQYHLEYERLKMKRDVLLRSEDRVSREGEIEALKLDMDMKKDQEKGTEKSLRSHAERDLAIRKYIKVLSDHFRVVENEYIEDKSFKVPCPLWNRFANHAMITHQDDMTKVDLPYFVRSASADITRWRFDVNAHVNAVNGDSIVFSHEQGTGPKNAGSIVEEILLDHIVRCRGESIKVIVSDNASVGKNWLCTIALPQYIVDQGLAEVVLVVFLENNHGKWLADMLFGQLQTRRRRTTLLGVDDLLKEFESINRKRGTVRGFALNPLSSVDFSAVFQSLVYETKPPKEFAFTRRNIHFAGACRPGAKGKLNADLLRIIGPALPDEPGMVRISCNPPSDKPQSQLRYDERCFDVPACPIKKTAAQQDAVTKVLEQFMVNETQVETSSPHSDVTLDIEYSAHGNGLVSNRTADHVGFNGYAFRNLPAFPELSNVTSDLVRRAWPPGLIERKELGNRDVRLIPGTESVKCAPENWIMHIPVYHMECPRTGPKARYPPRNLLNAQYKKGPRDTFVWVPTATYPEAPFPIRKGTAAYNAMKKLALRHTDKNMSLHVLQVLRVIFEDMGRDAQAGDNWLQKRATIPSRNAIENYRRELKLFIDREKRYPSPAVTVRQSFRRERMNIETAERILLERGLRQGDGRERNKVLKELFEKAELTPGALNQHQYTMQKDLERVTRDMAVYEEYKREFDKENGLLPECCDKEANEECSVHD